MPSALATINDAQEIIRQVEQDRLQLSDLLGYEVVGFAYLCAYISNRHDLFYGATREVLLGVSRSYPLK